MSNQTWGRGLILHFDGSHWIFREGRSRQQMSLYPVVIYNRQKIAFITHEFWKLKVLLRSKMHLFFSSHILKVLTLSNKFAES